MHALPCGTRANLRRSLALPPLLCSWHGRKASAHFHHSGVAGLQVGMPLLMKLRDIAYPAGAGVLKGSQAGMGWGKACGAQRRQEQRAVSAWWSLPGGSSPVTSYAKVLTDSGGVVLVAGSRGSQVATAIKLPSVVNTWSEEGTPA